MSPEIVAIQTAVKRAQHFTKDMEWGGPFSPVGRTGLSIPIRNGFWFWDLPSVSLEEDIAAELFIIWAMSRAINNWIDNNLVENNEEAKWALAAFLSRAGMWVDWSKLKE